MRRLGFLESPFCEEGVNFHPKFGEFRHRIDAFQPKHMYYIGNSNTVKSKFNNDQDEFLPCPYYKDYVVETGDDILEKLSTHAPVKRTEELFFKSFEKCDVPRVMPKGEFEGINLEKAHEIAVEYTYTQFNFLRDSYPTSDLDFNRPTSPGLPYTRMGFKTKGDVLDRLDLATEMGEQYMPIYTVSDKYEYLSREDIGNGKCRTFFAPDVTFLAHQKVFTTEHNDRMHDRCNNYDTYWSRYGMTKQYGGFNNLMKAHEKFDVHLTGDGSGWDRVIPLLPEVWSLRKHYLYMTIDLEPMFDYVATNTVTPLVGLPDGSVYQRVTGNNSGSNTTTTDNCIAHTIISYMFYLMLGWRRYGRWLTYAEIHDFGMASLYGDDSLASLHSKCYFFDYEDEPEIRRIAEIYFRQAYISYAVVIKSTQFNLVLGKPNGLEFLGSTSLLSDGYYHAVPRIGKLCTSITQSLKDKSPTQLVSSVLAMYELTSTVPEENCVLVRQALQRYGSYLISHNKVEGVDLSLLYKLQQVAEDDNSDVVKLVTGWE